MFYRFFIFFENTIHFDMKRIATVLMLAMLVVFASCKEERKTNTNVPVLCDRNEYSRNGVDSVYEYRYSTKDGVIDSSSKVLYSVRQYDSLGSVIYYKGKGSPIIPRIHDFIHCHLRIMDEYCKSQGTLPYSETAMKFVSTYKFDYIDTLLTKISYFNSDGDYYARIDHFDNGKSVADSLYINGKLSYALLQFYDEQGRDSLWLRYDDEVSSNLSFLWQVGFSYEQLNDSIVREYRRQKYRGWDYKKTHRYQTSSSYNDVTYNDEGKMVYAINKTGDSYSRYSYDSRGFKTESVSVSGYLKTKDRSVFEYNDYGLLLREYEYVDMTVLDEVIEYKYTYRKLQ